MLLLLQPSQSVLWLLFSYNSPFTGTAGSMRGVSSSESHWRTETSWTSSYPLAYLLMTSSLPAALFPSTSALSECTWAREEKKCSPIPHYDTVHWDSSRETSISHSCFLCFQNEASESLLCVKLQILSNWGHPKYTCLYRFRVHGIPSDHT